MPSGTQVGQSQCPAAAPASATAGPWRDAGRSCPVVARSPSPGLGSQRPAGWQQGVQVERSPGGQTGDGERSAVRG